MVHLICYCSYNQKNALSQFVSSWKKYYSHIHIYTDGWTGKDSSLKFYPVFDRCNDYATNCARKTEIIKIHYLTYNVDIILMDVDCEVIKDFSHTFTRDFDVGITVYPLIKKNKCLDNVSSGLLFLRHTPATIKFVNKWIEFQDGHVGRSRNQASLCHTLKYFKKNKVSLNIITLNSYLYNSHPDHKSTNYIKEWVKRIKKMKHELYMLHFAFGIWQNKKFLKEIKEIVYG